MSRNDPVELSVQYEHHTAAAILVSDGGEKCWIPRSQIEEEYDESFLDGLEKGDVIDITVPEWLAEDKGLW